MIALLQKYHRQFVLLLLILLGLAGGHLAATVLRTQLHAPAQTDLAAALPARTGPTATATADLNRILRNNLFDTNSRSTTASIGRESQVFGAARGSDRATRSDLKLVGTVVAGDESLALLESDRKLQIYRLGAELGDDGVIETVERNRVTVRNRNRSLTTLVLHEPSPTDAGTRPARPAAQPGDSAGGVRAVGDNRWLVSRELVESVRDNFAAELRLAQMQPRLVDDRTDGFLVQLLNPRSVLAKMGLKRGDVVIDVNNIKLDSPEKALQIFQQLREARRITLAVERNGQPLNFQYEIN
ncbi:MAG: type II secretion system protein GspC [Desulfuromonadales bacterium]|nr:type II secretion system protein GspC [Desulfuromonadales bacterium]